MFFTVTTMRREESAYHHPALRAGGHSVSIAAGPVPVPYGALEPVVAGAGGCPPGGIPGRAPGVPG
ncbi:hypothetical protein [Streptomyces sp. NBC_00316]|uniref:hypothetical protein n=1 Tax=Streptomyces sp. NBC_00316 TaxID=2975710 RepID=UPI002E2D17A3|nr:hypothetical protein [Streptomyces sp. NBC_00316]